MFDIGWTEMLVIAVVMIVVVGPKDLPRMLRTFGKMTTKVRGMAGDFQKQFNDALKEAELDDVKKSVDALRGLNPAVEIKKQLNPFEKAAADVRAGLDNAMKPKPWTSAEPAAQAVHEAEPLKTGATDMPGVAGPDAAPATPPPGLATSDISNPAAATPVGQPESPPVAAPAVPAPARKPRAAGKTTVAKTAPAPVIAKAAPPAAKAAARPAAGTAASKASPAPKAVAASAPKASPRKTK